MEPTRRYTRLLEKLFPYRFLLAKLTHIPFFRRVMTKMIFENNNLTYLPKDNVINIQINKKINDVDSVAVPSNVVEYFINKSSHRFIMNFCICRESMHCKNYPVELGCLFMGNAVKKIPKELGKLVSKEKALEHVKKCREKGLVHLIGRDKLDETWLGVGSKIPLVTVCNCCECCCLWKMRPVLHNNLSSTIKPMPHVRIQVTEKCNGCGTCTEKSCFIHAIKIKDGKAVISDECVICGRCAEVCPNNAIAIDIQNDNFIKETIKRVQKATT